VSVSSSDPREGGRSLQELRAARGEGWQWTRIQRDPCPQCGDHPAAAPATSLAGLVVERADGWREFLLSADDTYLRTNPGPVIFSPIQYAAHVRNMLQISGDRVMLGRDQDSPTVPMHDPADDEWESYNHVDVEAIAGDLASQARRLAEVLDGLDASAWSRVVINDRGKYGVYTFTLAGLACNAVHEEYHHLLDANGTLSPDQG
jgi:hypothetical protein